MINKDKAALTDDQINRLWVDARKKNSRMLSDSENFRNVFARAIEAAVLASADNPSTAGAAEFERAAFEKEFEAKGAAGTDHDVIGWYYFDDEIQAMWKAWQARASLAAPVAQSTAGAAEPLVFDDFPDFNAGAMGCGLEDRNITDRYEAMRYGFEEALDLVDERIKNFLADLATPALNPSEVREQVLEEAVLAAEKVQDDYNERQGGKWPEMRDDAATGAGDCASAIRALKGE